jgi:hypothetical protein
MVCIEYPPEIYSQRGSFPNNIATILKNFKFHKPLKIAHGDFGYNSPLEENTDLIIVDCSHHPFPHPKLTKHYNNIPILGLTGFYDSGYDLYTYYPHYFGYANFENVNDTNSNGFCRQYKFSCLNRSPKTERIWFYTQLFQQKFYKNSITSFFDTFPYGTDIQYNNLDEDTVDFFKNNISHLLPICISSEKNTFDKNGKNYDERIFHGHPAFTDTYINIISEHSYTEKFISEKTIKPIAAEQIFLMAGPQYAIRELRNLGFDVFDDIINHSYYDHEEDYKFRLLKMLEVATYLDSQNLKLIFEKTEQRRKHNKNYLFSAELRNQIFFPIIDFIRTNCP